MIIDLRYPTILPINIMLIGVITVKGGFYMAFAFIQNYLAPKCTEEDQIDMTYNSHMVLYDRCNYRCAYCVQAQKDFNNASDERYHELSDNEFIATILKLMETGKNFKFSGGEPTLNPDVEKHLKIVKDLGGTIFFDTNGSRPDIVKNLLDKGLIDVLAVSLKGLSPEECLDNAKIKRKDFCWDNPFKTIEYGSHTPNVKVIITHVCYNDVSLDELRRFSELLEPYPDVYYKINNLFFEQSAGGEYVRADSGRIVELLKELQAQKPFWKGRMIYVDNPSGVSNYDKILFM